MYRLLLSALILLGFFGENAISDEARILRYPSASKNQITFSYAGDLYVVSRTGGLARRVTTSEGIEIFPRFSQDGSQIAFSGEYDGNREVYTIPANGGEPVRLTYSMDQPGLPERMGPDKIIMQWTADGKILYRSRGETWNAWMGKLYTISSKGGYPEQVQLPHSGFATYNSDGSKIAYNKIFREFRTWKRYKGGQANEVWIHDFKANTTENITLNDAQDIIPMWYGNKIYFLSDRDKIMNIFSYDLTTKQTKKVTNFDKYDVKYASLGIDNISFENEGYVYILDLPSEKLNKIKIEIQEDNLWSRSKIIDLKDNISNYELNNDGSKAMFNARGDIYVTNVEKGISKNITETSGTHERNATFSPDGKWIAFISDETGEDEVYIISPDGKNKTQISKDSKNYKFELKWSPDSKKILSADREMNMVYFDIDSKAKTQITKSKGWEIRDFSWSPDSKYVLFSDGLDNLTTSGVHLYSLDDKKITVITENMFESGNGFFSDDSKYIFFVSGRTFSPKVNEVEWNFYYSDMNKVFGLTLQKDTKSPFLFDADEKTSEAKSDANNEESGKKKKGKDEPKTDVAKSTKIDMDGLSDRLFDIPIQAGNYSNLRYINGKLFYVRSNTGKGAKLYVFDFKTKKETEIGDFTSYDLSGDQKKCIYRSGRDFYVTNFGEKISDKDGKVDLSDLKMTLNKKEEWSQVYNEAWRQMRDFFYDPGMHQVDWKAMKEKYAVMVPYVNHRMDLTFLLGELIAELSIGHAYVGGGDMQKVEAVGIGYLGAEYNLDKKSGFYQIKNIFKGRNWEEKTRSPLTEPGIDVKVGDYLISINGVKVSESNPPSKMLLNKANKYVTIAVNSSANENGAKEFTIKTIAGENGLRYLNWVEKNREYVEKATNGKVGYIHIPDMGVDNGLNEFVKYFYPQTRKEALIIDDRYNGGGNVSPMIIERLRRVLNIAKHARGQEIVTTNPDAVMCGPMVLLLNEISASDGDLFPYQFKKNNLGKLIGKRSWGGVIGIRGSLPFLDGSYMMKPEFANFGYDGTWVLEGTGMTPDIEVENDPSKEMQGIDQQLDRAIEEVLKEIPLNTKSKVPNVPPFPDKR
jgi:tricorn protease